MGRVDRWLNKKDFDDMKMKYSKNMMAHLKAMTVVFTVHRQSREFQKLREFDFQNMIRKSDYLLSLYITKESFIAAVQNGLREEVHKILDLYNSERKYYDKKMITITDG